MTNKLIQSTLLNCKLKIQYDTTTYPKMAKHENTDYTKIM